MWTYAATVARLAMQVVLTAILARLLGPQPFGIMGMALPVIGFLALLADQGLASALVQRTSVTPDQIRAAFTRLLLGSVAAAAVCLLTSDWIARSFREPALVRPLAALSLVLIPGALSSISGAVLRRELRIRSLQIAYVASYAAGFGLIGLPLAVAGFGVWSLVAASIAHACAFAIGSYVLARHPIRPCMRGSAGLSRFGSRAALAGLLSWLTENLSSIVIARTLGAVSVAVFNAAYNTVRTPATALATGGLDMLFASSARAEESKTFRQRAFKVSSGLVAVVSLPAFVTLALIPETLIIVLYGPKWTAAIPLLPPLALAMPAVTLAGVGSALTASAGRPGRDFLVQLSTVLALAVSVPFALGYSAQAVAWVFFAAMLFRCISSLWIALRLAGLRWKDLAASLHTGVLLALCIPPVVYLLDRSLGALHLHRAWVLAADATAGGLALGVGVLVLKFTMPREIRWAVAQALRRIPFELASRVARMFERGPSDRPS